MPTNETLQETLCFSFQDKQVLGWLSLFPSKQQRRAAVEQILIEAIGSSSKEHAENQPLPEKEDYGLPRTVTLPPAHVDESYISSLITKINDLEATVNRMRGGVTSAHKTANEFASRLGSSIHELQQRLSALESSSLEESLPEESTISLTITGVTGMLKSGIEAGLKGIL